MMRHPNEKVNACCRRPVPASTGAVTTSHAIRVNAYPVTSLSSSSSTIAGAGSGTATRDNFFSNTQHTVESIRVASQLLWLYVHDCILSQPGLTRVELESIVDVFATQMPSTPAVVSSLLPSNSRVLFTALVTQDDGVVVFAKVAQVLAAALLSDGLWVGAPLGPCSLPAVMCLILMHAVEGGVLACDAVAALVELGVDINVVDVRGATTLMFAAKAGHTPLVGVLIAAGANVNALALDGNTSLLRAVEWQDAEMVRMLIDAKADVHARMQGIYQYCPLAVACRNNNELVVETLLAAKAGVEDVDSRGYVPLEMAVAGGHVELVQMLLRATEGIETGAVDRMLLCAAKNDCTAVVKVLIDARADVCVVDGESSTALLYAVTAHNAEMVQLLLDAQADVEQRDLQGNSPLSVAVDRRSGCACVAQMLLAAKADLESVFGDAQDMLFAAAGAIHADLVHLLFAADAVVDARGHSETSTLPRTAGEASVRVVQRALDAKANIECRDKGGYTPLMRAAECGNTTVVQVLLAAKADPSAVDSDFQYLNPSLIAVEVGHVEVLKMLMWAGAVTDAHARDKLLVRAANCGHVAVARVLLDARADARGCGDSHETPLSSAVRRQHAEMVQLLLDAKASVDECGDEDDRPLMEASEIGNVTLVTKLLAAKACVDGEDRFGRGFTPLVKAAYRGHAEVMQLLLRSGASVEAPSGGIALVRAVELGHVAVVKVLLDARIDVCVRDNKGNTVLLLAAKRHNAEIVQMLLDAKACVHERDNAGHTPLLRAAATGDMGDAAVVQVLLSAKASVSDRDSCQNTPLMMAARAIDGETVRILVDAGAAVDTKNNQGQTALSLAATEGRVTAVKALIDARADVRVRSVRGYCPLHAALSKLREKMESMQTTRREPWERSGHSFPYYAWVNCVPIVQRLLLAKAEVESVDEDGYTPLMVAAMLGHTHVVRMLASYRYTREALTLAADADGRTQTSTAQAAPVQDFTANSKKKRQYPYQ